MGAKAYGLRSSTLPRCCRRRGFALTLLSLLQFPALTFQDLSHPVEHFVLVLSAFAILYAIRRRDDDGVVHNHFLVVPANWQISADV